MKNKKKKKNNIKIYYTIEWLIYYKNNYFFIIFKVLKFYRIIHVYFKKFLLYIIINKLQYIIIYFL